MTSIPVTTHENYSPDTLFRFSAYNRESLLHSSIFTAQQLNEDYRIGVSKYIAYTVHSITIFRIFLPLELIELDQLIFRCL
jgi:hypothetical protein